MSLYLNGKKVDNIDKAIVSEDGWIGIGAALERIVFDGSGNDISVLGANLGVGVSDPGYTTEIGAVAGSDGRIRSCWAYLFSSWGCAYHGVDRCRCSGTRD